MIAAEVTIASSDFGPLEPMATGTLTELCAAGVTGALDVVVAGAGCWHHEPIQGVIDHGI